MAIINSIALGKASGKLGNVIFQTYNKMTVARQKNDTISTEPTEAQVLNQNKLFNCGRACAFIKTFIMRYKQYNQGSLSFEAWFTKNAFKYFTNIRALRGFQGIRQLHGQSLGNAHIQELTNIELLFNAGLKVGVRVYFNNRFEQPEDNMIMYVICTNITQHGYFLPISDVRSANKLQTDQDWENSYIDILINDFDTQFVVAYSNQYYSYSDNMLFSQIFE